MKETSKATERRLRDFQFWRQIFQGDVIDVGPGDDPLDISAWPEIEKLFLFDKAQGDANKIDEYFPGRRFDCVHGSQVLEHLYDPIDALYRFYRMTKPGGYIVMTVPDWFLYEHHHWPSRFNGDHKTTWSLWQTENGIPGVRHIYVPRLKASFPDDQVALALCCQNYDWTDLESDQTLDYEKRVEAFIEIVIRKAQ